MSDYPELNVDLLDKIRTLEAFQREGVEMDERWDQGTWGKQGPTCGTAMCFAGWAVQLAGHRLVPDPNGPRCVVEADRRAQRSAGHHWLIVERDGGQREEIAYVAQRELGLTDRECVLFNGSNELHDIEHIVGDIKDGLYREDGAA